MRSSRPPLRPSASEANRWSAVNLTFPLVSSRYELASLIVTQQALSPPGARSFGNKVVAAAKIDGLIHHTEILSLKGDSNRLLDRDLGGRPTTASPHP